MLKKIFVLLSLFLTLSQSALNTYSDQTALGGNLFLVNRTYRISPDYIPNDLVMPNVSRATSSVLMRKEAAEHLELLFQAAKEERLYLTCISGYRSYQTQNIIYNRKLKKVGKERANLYVALPGASEHQLGLAMDIDKKGGSGLNGSFGKTKEGAWIRENCHKFGFILRYKEEWTDITGYAYEPWHIRYVGEEHAKTIYEMDMPFETYIQTLSQAHRAVTSAEKEKKE